MNKLLNILPRFGAKLVPALFFLVACSGSIAKDVYNEKYSLNFNKFLTLDWGSKVGKIGIIKLTDKVHVPEGPNSFFVTNNEKIYILDSVNQGINIYSNNKFERKIKIQTKYYPVDFYVQKDKIILLTNLTLEIINKNGITLQKKILGDHPELEGGLWRLFYSHNLIIVTTAETDYKIVCLKLADLSETSCNSKILSNKYDLLDSWHDSLYAFDQNDSIIKMDDMGKISYPYKDIGYSGKDYVMFELRARYRFRKDAIFYLNPEPSGLVVYKAQRPMGSE